MSHYLRKTHRSNTCQPKCWICIYIFFKTDHIVCEATNRFGVTIFNALKWALHLKLAAHYVPVHTWMILEWIYLNGCKHSHWSNAFPGQCAREFLFQSLLSCAPVWALSLLRDSSLLNDPSEWRASCWLVHFWQFPFSLKTAARTNSKWREETVNQNSSGCQILEF